MTKTPQELRSQFQALQIKKGAVPEIRDSALNSLTCNWSLNQTQPVGLGRPAILHAPLPGPEGKSS